MLFVLFGYGIVGFVDDYWKIKRKNTDGLIARWKYFWLSVIALIAVFGIYAVGKDTAATQLVVPFFRWLGDRTYYYGRWRFRVNCLGKS